MSDETPDPADGSGTRLAAAIGTVRRKLARSFATRGVGPTLARAAIRPLRWVISRLRPSEIAERRRDRAFDRAHGVDTRRESDPGWMARIESANWRYGTGYEPARTATVEAALDAVSIDFDRSTFVDYGCGKGKVLLLASHRGFRRIVGVEYDPRLAEIARENARRYAAPERRTRRIDVRCADAAGWEIPDDPLVLFFHHPFEAPVFRPVIDRLRASLRARPRPVRVVYVDPRCVDLFERAGFRTIDRPREGCVVLGWEPAPVTG